jgi:hypothetical protein
MDTPCSGRFGVTLFQCLATVGVEGKSTHAFMVRGPQGMMANEHKRSLTHQLVECMWLSCTWAAKCDTLVIFCSVDWGAGNVCELYEYSVRESGERNAEWCGGVIVCLVYVPCDCRKDAASSCYIRAGTYAWYLNQSTLVKNLPAGIIGIFHSHEIIPIALLPWGRYSL